MKNHRGFTLIELLIVIFMLSIVMGAGYTVFLGSTRATTQQTQDSKMQDNARMAMDVLSRNFRRLGFQVDFDNYPVGTTINGAGTKLIHTDNLGVNSSDAVTLVGGNPAAVANLAVSADTGATAITLDNAAGIVASDVIYLGLTHTAVVANLSGNVLTLDTSAPDGALSMSYPGQDQATKKTAVVGLVQTTTFDVQQDGAGRFLFRQDAQPLADDIEDFQVQYGVDRDNNRLIDATEWTSTPPATDIDLIRIAEITVVARTVREDPAMQGVVRNLPAYGNRPTRPVNDGFKRLILTRIVLCRNMDILPVQ